MLWYLHLCADAGVVVVDYSDEATGTLTETENGNGKFVEVTINPRVTIKSESDVNVATILHNEAHKFCFIANSMNFPVNFEPEISVEKAVVA